jgi:hypothetical protein
LLPFEEGAAIFSPDIADCIMEVNVCETIEEQRPSSDSDVDISDEFEFLEQYDVDNSEETK